MRRLSLSPAPVAYLARASRLDFSHLESKNNHTPHSVFLEGSVKEFKRHMKVFYKL